MALYFETTVVPKTDKSKPVQYTRAQRDAPLRAPLSNLPEADNKATSVVPKTNKYKPVQFRTSTEQAPLRPPLDQVPGTATAAWEGIEAGLQGVAQTGDVLRGKRPQEGFRESGAAAPFEWGDLTSPLSKGLPKTAYRIGESLPSVYGGVAGGLLTRGSPVGGAAGAGLGTMVQELGPNYVRRLRETPNNPDLAYDKAVNDTLVSGTFSSASWAAFPVKFWQGPIKNAVTQAFGVQPAIGLGHQATTNIRENRPVTEGFGPAYAQSVAGMALPMVGEAAVRGILPHPPAPAAEPMPRPPGLNKPLPEILRGIPEEPPPSVAPSRPSYMAAPEELTAKQWTPAQMARELGISEEAAAKRQSRFTTAAKQRPQVPKPVPEGEPGPPPVLGKRASELEEYLGGLGKEFSASDVIRDRAGKLFQKAAKFGADERGTVAFTTPTKRQDKKFYQFVGEEGKGLSDTDRAALVSRVTSELEDKVRASNEAGVLRKAYARLADSPAYDSATRVYLNRVLRYTFIGESGTVSKPKIPIMVREYNKLTNGHMFAPVSLRDLYEAYKGKAEYVGTTEEAAKKGKYTKPFYVKTYEQFLDHLKMYGTTIDELAKIPEKEHGPWVVDKENGVVYLAPRLPGEKGVAMLADKLPPASGVKVSARLPAPERMGPEPAIGRTPREAKHHKEFTSLFTERFPTAARGMPGPPKHGARKPGARGPGDTGKGRLVVPKGRKVGPQPPKQPAPMTTGPSRSSGMQPVAGPRGGKVPPSHPKRALKGTRTPSSNPIVEAWHSLQSYLSPSTASGGARGAHQIIRGAVGENKRKFIREATKIEAYRGEINKLDPKTKKAIRDYIQGHQDVIPMLSKITAPWKEFVDHLRDVNKNIADTFRELPAYRQKEFEENYLSQYWKESMGERKKMRAKGHFIEKKYATYREGEAKGLHAKFDDPIEIQFQYMKDVFNFLSKEKALDEMKQLDYAKVLNKFQREPIGTTLLKHVGRRRIYAAEDVARVWENSWGPGVFEHTDMGKLYLDTVHALNASTAFVLGLSTYHAFNVAHGAIELNIQSAIKALSQGRAWTAAKGFASAPAAPYTLFRKGSVLHDVFTGKAAPKDARTAKIANLLAQSNMTVAEFEQIYRASGHMNWVEAYKSGLLGKELKTNIKEAMGMGRSRLPFGPAYSLLARTLDSVMHPLFSYAIPRMKAGAFYQKLNAFMDSHPGATDFELVQEAQRVADSIENVEGMMTQQNVMVAPLLKQTANLVFMAPGWTFGAIRAYGQGTVDLARMAGKAAIGRKAPMTESAAYVLASAITLAGLSAFYQFLATQELPDSPLDLIAPKTGGKNRDGTPERLLMPGNFKDLLGYYHDPASELENKVRPPWRAAREIAITNKDWRGDPVRNRNDPLSTQLGQAAAHIVKTAGVPISIQQYGTAEQGSAISNPARTLGFRPVGQWLASPERTERMDARATRKAWQKKLRFERRRENRRAPVTKPLTFAKPDSAPPRALRFAQ